MSYIIKSVKFIGKSVGLISFTIGCEYIKGDSKKNRGLMFIHRWN